MSEPSPGFVRGPRSPLESRGPTLRHQGSPVKQKKASSAVKSESESDHESRISNQSRSKKLSNQPRLNSYSDSEDNGDKVKKKVDERRKRGGGGVPKEVSESDSDASPMKEPAIPPPRVAKRQNSRSSRASCNSRSPSNSRQSQSPMPNRKNSRKTSKVTNSQVDMSDDEKVKLSSDESEFKAAKGAGLPVVRHKRQSSTNARLKMLMQDDSELEKLSEKSRKGRRNSIKNSDIEKRKESRKQTGRRKSSETGDAKKKDEGSDDDYVSKPQRKITPIARPSLILSSSDNEKPKKVIRRRRSSVLQKNIPDSSSDEEEDEVRKRPPKLQRMKQKKEIEGLKRKVTTPMSSDTEYARMKSRERSEKGRDAKKVCARPNARIKSMKEVPTSSESESYNTYRRESGNINGHVPCKKRAVSPMSSSESEIEIKPTPRRNSTSSDCGKDDLRSGHGKGPPKIDESPPKLDVEGNIKDRKKTETLMKLFSAGNKGGKGGKGGGGKGKGVPGIVVKCEPDRTERTCDDVKISSSPNVKDVLPEAKDVEVIDTKKPREDKKLKDRKTDKLDVKIERKEKSPDSRKNFIEIPPFTYKNEGSIPSLMCHIDLNRISIVLKKRTSEDIRTKTELADTRQKCEDVVKSEKKSKKEVKGEKSRTEKVKKRAYSSDESEMDVKCDKVKEKKKEEGKSKHKSKSDKGNKWHRHERLQSPIVSDTDIKKADKTSDLGSDIEKTPEKGDLSESDKKQKSIEKAKFRNERKRERRPSVSSVSTESSQKSDVPPGRRKDKDGMNHKHKRRKVEEGNGVDGPKKSSPVSIILVIWRT